MRGRRARALWLALGTAWLAGCAEHHVAEADPLGELRAEGARVHVRGGTVTRVYGAPLARGDDASDSAERFVRERAAALGVEARDLYRAPPAGASTGADTELSVMYDASHGRHRFSLVRYVQARAGVPVYGAELRLLVRDEPGHPVVLASSTLEPLGAFVPSTSATLAPVHEDLANAFVDARRDRGDFTGKPLEGPARLSSFTEPTAVIWAGDARAHAPPRLASTFVGDNEGDPRAPRTERWLFVADAVTGAILHAHSLVHYDVTGTVRGRVTSGPDAAECAAEPLTPFGDARASLVDGGSAFADDAGGFGITHADGSPVTVSSRVEGRHFRVLDAEPARDEVLTTLVTPPGPADFIHNDANTSEAVRAQANAYVHANRVRDWLLAVHPGYPDVDGQVGFPIRVNRDDDICPGNAWYDGSSLSFCLSFDDPSPPMPDYANSAFGSIIAHEYGHHLVEIAGGGLGQGQAQYGEGMSDVIAMLHADDARLGRGFFTDQCALELRNADNDCQYLAGAACSSCGDEVHDCGRLLSGAIWDLRQALGLSLTSSLAVSAMLLHTSNTIEPDVAIDFLTLDDDDASLGNGTPNQDAICAAFGAHGLDCPAQGTGFVVSPERPRVLESPAGGPVSPASTSFEVANLGPGALDFSVTSNAPWLTITGGAGTLAPFTEASVGFTPNAAALQLPRGVHTASVTFTNTTTGAAIARVITLRIGYERIYRWDLSTNPGWSTRGAWEYGVPTGGGGNLGDDDFGNPDPTSGYTGSNVYGYALGGNYANDISSAQDLTTNAIDCSELSQVTLKFQRWLGVENAIYDSAQVEVSTNRFFGWRTVWQNAQTLNGGSWSEQSFDISEVAALQRVVYVRWRMGPTDVGWRYAGWNVDDVEIWGIRRPACTGAGDCSDGAFCNGAETCSPVDGCQAASDPCAGLGCDEAMDTCLDPDPVDAGMAGSGGSAGTTSDAGIDAGAIDGGSDASASTDAGTGGEAGSGRGDDDTSEAPGDDEPSAGTGGSRGGDATGGSDGTTAGAGRGGQGGNGGKGSTRGVAPIAGSAARGQTPISDGDHEQAPDAGIPEPTEKRKHDSGCATAPGRANRSPLGLFVLASAATLCLRRRRGTLSW